MNYISGSHAMPNQINKQSDVFKQCEHCPNKVELASQDEFIRHLRDEHCRREGGSFVCHYGYNGVCSSLPVEGVNDRDYEAHILRQHVHYQLSPKPKSQASAAIVRPNLVSDQLNWSIYKSSQNLASVLNDPSKGKQRDFFTRTWGESFVPEPISPSPLLPRISIDYFQVYLRKISKRYRKHIRMQTSLPTKGHPQSDELVKKYPKLKAAWNLDPQEVDVESIPKIYLKNNLELSDPETFECVFELSSSSPLSPTASPQHGVCVPQRSHTLLHEQMSHYLDIVEVKIARQIAEKKDELFHAMSSHRALSEQLSKTVAAVKTLRHKMRAMDDGTVESCLKVLRFQRLRQNYCQVYSKLKIMSTVHQTQPTVQALLATSDYLGALSLISTTQDVLRQELTSVACLRYLGPQLEEKENLIDKLLRQDLLKWYQQDLSQTHKNQSSPEDQGSLVAVLMGFLQQKKTSFIDIYKEEATTVVKALIKQAVIEAVSCLDSRDCVSNTLEDQLKMLEFNSWLDMIDVVFGRLEVLLTRMQLVFILMTDVVNVAAGDSAHTQINAAQFEDDERLSCAQHQELLVSINALKCEMCNYIQERCTNLFQSRSVRKLNKRDFVKLHQRVVDFISVMESVLGQKSSKLTSILEAQGREFVQKFHGDLKSNLLSCLDSEQWKTADVPEYIQIQLQHFVDHGEVKNVSESDRVSSHLNLNGDKFCIVGSCIMLVNIMFVYLNCSADVPKLAPKLGEKLGDLFLHYNSRCSNLLLGTQAIQSAGLKTITARNLILGWRSLQLLYALIIPILNYFKTFTNSTISQLHKAEQLLLEHGTAIRNKLATIGSSSVNNLSSWYAKPPSPSDTIRNICKQQNKIHQVLLLVLQHKDIRTVFIEIHRRCLVAFKARVDQLDINNDGGPQHGVVTQEIMFYLTHLKSLGCLTPEDIGSPQDLWKSNVKR